MPKEVKGCLGVFLALGVSLRAREHAHTGRGKQIDPARNGGEWRVWEQHRFPLSSVAWENCSRKTLWVSQKLSWVLPLSLPLDHTTIHEVATAFYFP